MTLRLCDLQKDVLAKPDLIVQEQDAWQATVSEKHAHLQSRIAVKIVDERSESLKLID